MGEYSHRIVDLNVHMVANSRKLFALSGNDTIVPTLDLVRRSTVFTESSSHDDGITIFLMFVCFFALILDINRDLGMAKTRYALLNIIRAHIITPLAFADERFETRTTTS